MNAPAHPTLDFVEAYSSAAEWFAITLASVDARALVPSCPGWTVYDLVVHLGNVHAWAATIVETGREAPEQNDQPHSHRSKALSEWYVGKAEDLYAVLRGCDPAAPCWNFAFGSGAAAFWRRRQVHETLVHGVDLALAAKREPRLLPPDLATDGVDEALTVFVRRMHQRGHPATLTDPISLLASDTGASWTLTPVADAAPAVSAGALDGDRIEAPAEVLLQLLWKRLPSNDPAIGYTGNARRIAAFLKSRLTA